MSLKIPFQQMHGLKFESLSLSGQKLQAAAMIATATACLLFIFGCSRQIEPPELSITTLDPALAETVSDARNEVRAKPNSAAAWGRLGQAFHAAECEPQARLCYAQAMKLHPESDQWHHLLGLLLLQDEPDAAFVHLARAAELSPGTNDTPRLRLAQALIEHGRFDEAAVHLNAMLNIDAAHPAARLELARVRLAANDANDAIELLQPCLSNPYTARGACLLLSQAYQRRGEIDHAAHFADRAAVMPKPFDWPDPFLREVQRLKRAQENSIAEQCNALLMHGRLEEAGKLLGDLLQHDPENAEALLLLGRLRFQQRRCADAQQILHHHLKLRPESLQGFVQLGLAHFCQSQWQEAAGAFTRALELKPDFAQAHYNLGLALSRQGNSSGAIQSFRDALRCGPGDPAAHAALAEELFRAGNSSEALQEAEQALSLDPNQRKARVVRDEVLSKRR